MKARIYAAPAVKGLRLSELYLISIIELLTFLMKMRERSDNLTPNPLTAGAAYIRVFISY